MKLNCVLGRGTLCEKGKAHHMIPMAREILMRPLPGMAPLVLLLTLEQRFAMSSSTGASLPPELFKLFLGYVLIPPMDIDSVVRSGARAKRSTSTCARVCRYWGRICRPRLLRHVILRSAPDLREFIEFLESPPIGDLEAFASLVEFVTVAVDINMEPWLDNVPLSLLPQFRRLGIRPSIALIAHGGQFQPGGPSSLLHRTPRFLPLDLRPISRATLAWNTFFGVRELSRALPIFFELRAVTILDIVRVHVHGADHLREIGTLELTAATSRRRGRVRLGTASALVFLRALVCRRVRPTLQPPAPARGAVIITTGAEDAPDIRAVLSILATDFYENSMTGLPEAQYQSVRHIHRERVADVRCKFIPSRRHVRCSRL